MYKYFSPSNPIYKPALCFDGVGLIFSSFFKYKSSGGPCLVHFYQPLYALILMYKLWGPVSISIFHHLIQWTNLLYVLMVWGSYFYFFPNTDLVRARVHVVHFYHPIYALILIHKLWGPVSISISYHLCTNLLYDVGCLYFTLSPNTNLPFKLWAPVSISIFNPLFLNSNMLYALMVWGFIF